ncbi:hypothetical protein [Lacisediminihabitans profunda]|uniref:DUF2218 domain-containing protein n=1 Tax=Lacisediminihabitans profunda TaxID=2594790 RepID=A0A5C8UTP6_9MICO|nr:hypothetical protein [Lacisediminihabitans profunda]TXN30986.1 hypothetical protein FVP33_05145 [Lacisediminihabitans profunda]
MLALTATVRPTDSSLPLVLLRERLHRFEHVPVAPNRTMVLIQGVGRVLVRDEVTTLRLDAVARYEDMLDTIRAVITKEVAGSVLPESRDGLTLTWERPHTVPVELR